MKMLKLTLPSGKPVYVNVDLIAAVLPTTQGGETASVQVDGEEFEVTETVNEVLLALSLKRERRGGTP